MADTPRRRRTAVIAAVALGLGGALVARAAWLRDPALHVSPTIGYVVGAVLVAAALALVAQAWEHPRMQAGLAA
ncbi:MAG TPA: hypothetical protein VFJ74_02165, partial [Gemmatimonadaceae bacterium]|nr:hypothetical protein [Gemmatimonadaceae bacterium]